MNSSLGVVAGILVSLLLIVAVRQRRYNNDLSEWSTAHGSLGGLLMFVLMAGEVFTTFTLLGQSGFSYNKGGAAFYMTAFDTLVYPTLYFLQPLIWKRSRELKVLSQSEYFSRAFSSHTLGKIITVVAGLALIPYIAIQISGLSVIASQLTHNALSPQLAQLWAVIGIMAYGIIGGIRGTVNLALVKDFLLMIIILVIGVYLPLHLYGSWPYILHQVEKTYPNFTTIHSSGNGYVWFITTSLIMWAGYSFWPHAFSSIFAANSPKALRRSQVLAPLYTFLTIPILMVGFTARLNNPHVPYDQQDQALLNLTLHHMPEFMVIIVAVGGMLTALIPSTVMAISMSMNIIKTFIPVTAQGTSVISERTETRVVKVLVPIIASLAALMSLYAGESIQELGVAGYGIISQLTVPFVIDQWNRKCNRTRKIPLCAIISGLLSGVVIAACAGFFNINYMSLRKYLPEHIAECNIGVVALLINIAVVTIVNIAYRMRGSSDTQTLQISSTPASQSYTN